MHSDDSNDWLATLANSPLPVVEAGVACYAKLGVPAAQLVLAFPWYGIDYECLETSGSWCNVACGNPPCAQEISLTRVASLLEHNATGGGRQWEANSSSPFFWYANSSGSRHRVVYDDSESLRLKYVYAKAAGVRGIGMWTAGGAPNATNAQMWNDLRVFRGGLSASRKSGI